MLRHEGRGGRGRLRPGPTRRIAQEIYGADDVVAGEPVQARCQELEAAGLDACRFASPRPNIPSPTILLSSERLPGIVRPCVKSGCALGRDLSSFSWATSAPCPGCRAPRCGTNPRRRLRDRRPFLTPVVQRGVGASARISFSDFKALHSADGIFALIICALRLASLARCTPGATLTTAGWPSGKCSAASGSLTL